MDVQNKVFRKNTSPLNSLQVTTTSAAELTFDIVTVKTVTNISEVRRFL